MFTKEQYKNEYGTSFEDDFSKLELGGNGYPWPEYLATNYLKKFTLSEAKRVLTSPKLEPSEVTKSTPICEVNYNPTSVENFGILQIDDYGNYAEPPVLEACKALFRKNIQTVFSSANFKNIKFDEAAKIICVDLSSENIDILKKISPNDILEGETATTLHVDIDSVESTVGEVEVQFLNIVSHLKQQPLMRGFDEITYVNDLIGLMNNNKNIFYDSRVHLKFYSKELRDLYFEAISEEQKLKAKKRILGWGNNIQSFFQCVHALSYFPDDRVDLSGIDEHGCRDEYEKWKANYEKRLSEY